MKRNVEITDLLKYRFLSVPSFSPDGEHICFRVHQALREENCYSTNLWIYNLSRGDLRQLTTSGKEKIFAWKPDGRSLIFASERQEPEKNKTYLYSISIDGGEAYSLAQIPMSLSSLAALNNDMLLITASFEPKYENPDEGDYIVFDQIPFCSNGKGYTGQRRNGLYVYKLSTGELTRLSPEDMDVENFCIDEKCKKVLAWGPRYRYVKGLYNVLWEFDVTTGRGSERLQGETFTCRWAGYVNGDIWVTGSYLDKHGVNENVKFYKILKQDIQCISPDLDRGLRNSIGCDCRYGTTDLNLAFYAQDDTVWFVSTDNFRSHLHTIKSDGSIKQVTHDLFSVDDYRIYKDMAAVIGLKGLALQELYLVKDGKEQQVTHFNDWLGEECNLPEPVHVVVDNGTDMPIDGWYMKPVNYEEDRTYPAILNIHGGPKMTFGDVFFHEMQYWAAQGYGVFFCNPRGSDGKGNGFDDIRGKYGTVDYEDIMTFTHWIIENVPFVDRNRLGVTGGSYGGFMTNWIIGHTNLFKAAVSQRSISNWVSKAGVSDIGYYFVPDQQAADIWTDVEKLWWHSPLKYADQAQTPTLFLHSDEDYRCELSQGLQMFSALKRHGVESRMCVFKGENHELSRSGKPRQRLARLREMTNWFDRFLKDKR
ncbi:MAG TPA: S9 family peptidase [Aminobacterium sp.]|jgi:dipeptidyl aminopeptidase/acylaminoacyl peptidase|uniref:alpha/beta hydrolase family protein n=1 Tax=Aminobacterium TaxID=81466 RepID=UPI000EDF6F3B|nr:MULTISPECIES: S9 family peptidase [unclassified Aminobacterium]HCA40138.1 S9 family peptidase [Aminobacterium sp.]